MILPILGSCVQDRTERKEIRVYVITYNMLERFKRKKKEGGSVYVKLSKVYGK